MRTAMFIMVLTCLLPAAVVADDALGPPVDRLAAADSAAREEGASAVYAALDSGDAQKALALLKSRTIELAPGEGKSLEGRALLLSGKPIRARKALEAAIRQRPNDPASLYWLGRAYETSGSYALAAAQYDKANLAGLESYDLHLHWAQVLRESGVVLGDATQRRVSKAEAKKLQLGEFYEGGLVISKNSARRSRVILCQKDSAFYQAYRALAREPKRPDALLLVGELWAEIGRHEQAVEKFEIAAGRVEEDQVVRCQKGWADSLLAMGDLEGYIKHSRAWMEAQGKVNSATLAACYSAAAAEAARRGSLPKQIRYLTLAVELKPAVDDLLQLADVLLQAERPHDAERYLQQAKELETSNKQKSKIERYQLRADYRMQMPQPQP